MKRRCPGFWFLFYFYFQVSFLFLTVFVHNPYPATTCYMVYMIPLVPQR
ncbi:hypothetical protein NTGHW29_330007 [Candidatus Nitrotoga sp. HW29]|nr:hypothetical protein NTGHW29_330007 [Candidatus Nitrotoga sp. HW29]